MLRTIVLHGALAAQFGPSFRLDVATPAEALRALTLQLKGFRQAIRNGHYRVTRYRRGRPFDCGEEMLRFPLGSASELHFVPVIAGAGSPSRGTSTGKVIAGAVLVAAAVTTAFVLGPAGINTIIGSTPFTVGNVLSTVAVVGVGLALSGIAGLLTKQPQLDESFMFGGDLNVTAQGGPVPLVCGGPIMAGSVTISAGLFTTALAVGSLPANDADGTVFNPAAEANTVTYAQSG